MGEGVAYRGFVYHGAVWAWPTVLWTHADALSVLPWLGEGSSCRWRQWTADDRPDFDTGTSAEDEALVEAWLAER